MGLGDFKKGDDSDTSRDDNGSSNESSNSSTSYKYDKRMPYAVIKAEGGVFEPEGYSADMYPNTRELTFRQPTETHHGWKLHEEQPSEWKEVWWSKDSFDLACRKVDEVLNVDLERLVKENPELALEAVRDANKQWSSDNNANEASKRQRCYVCDSLIHLYYGDYERVDTHVVCEEHTAAELAESGIFN